LYRD
jgi:hypothetical protein